MHLIHQPHHSAVSSDNSDEAQNVLFDRKEYILHNIVSHRARQKKWIRRLRGSPSGYGAHLRNLG